MGNIKQDTGSNPALRSGGRDAGLTMAGLTDQPLRFGRYSLEVGRRVLLRDGAQVPLGVRAFDLLATLVDGRGRVIGRDELIRRVWPGVQVDENNLGVTMSALRKALQELPGEPRIIQTVAGRGYQFVAPLLPSPSAAAPSLEREEPSIVVLPFDVLGGGPADPHIGSGIAEDITAELSCNRWLTVIAHDSAFTVRKGALPLGEIARQLDVRYILQGTVRQSGRRVRVAAQLVDGRSGAHLLAERYDRELADLFSGQDEITSAIIAAVRPALYDAELARSMRKHPDSLDAWSACQRGVWLFARPEEPGYAEAPACFQRAIALDPRYAPGYYGLALTYIHDGSAFVPGAVLDWQPRGEGLALKAVSLDERDSAAHAVLAVARMVRGDHAGALEATDCALGLNSNEAAAYGTRGATLVFAGRIQEGLRALERSLRLSPRDPRLRIRLAHIGLGRYFARDMEAAEGMARSIMRQFPHYGFGPRLLAVVLAETGRTVEAREALQAAIALAPLHFSDFRHTRMPWYRQEDHQRVVRALRLAGLPPGTPT